MSDEEVRQQIERTDAFIADFRELIAPILTRQAHRGCLPSRGFGGSGGRGLFVYLSWPGAASHG
jgi:hypothetical protein